MYQARRNLVGFTVVLLCPARRPASCSSSLPFSLSRAHTLAVLLRAYTPPPSSSFHLLPISLNLFPSFFFVTLCVYTPFHT